MSRKYDTYQVVANFGTINEEVSDYRDAFALYQRTDAPKTLYGIKPDGDVGVILSKG